MTLRSLRTVGEGRQSVYVFYYENEKAGEPWPCKIGKAEGDPLLRVLAQKSAMSRMPVIGLVIMTNDATSLERQLHKCLKVRHAECPGREWFVTSPKEVEQVYCSVLGATDDFGWLIRKARTESGLSQSDLAKLCGIRQATVSELETGARNARVGTLQNVLSALKLELRIVPCGLKVK
jgi:DNA-binding XRE family transcriptional regulator